MKEALRQRITDNEGLIGFASCYLIISGYENITNPMATSFETYWGWAILILSLINVYPYFRKLIFNR